MMENNIKDIALGTKIICEQSEAQKNCPVTYTYNFNEIKNELLDNRFEILDIWKDHIFIYDIENYKNFSLDLFCDECGINEQSAKYCAFIAVDEIIELSEYAFREVPASVTVSSKDLLVPDE